MKTTRRRFSQAAATLFATIAAPWPMPRRPDPKPPETCLAFSWGDLNVWERYEDDHVVGFVSGPIDLGGPDRWGPDATITLPGGRTITVDELRLELGEDLTINLGPT